MLMSLFKAEVAEQTPTFGTTIRRLRVPELFALSLHKCLTRSLTRSTTIRVRHALGTCKLWKQHMYVNTWNCIRYHRNNAVWPAREMRLRELKMHLKRFLRHKLV